MLSTHTLLPVYAADRGRCPLSHQDLPGGRASGGQPEGNVGPSGLSPSDFVKRKLHQRLMAGRAKTLSPAEAPGGVMTPEAGSTRPEAEVESTHAHREECGLLGCSGSEEETQGLLRGRTAETGEGTRGIHCQECRGPDRAGVATGATGQQRAMEAAAGDPSEEAGCLGCCRGAGKTLGSPGGCPLTRHVVCHLDNRPPVDESVLRSDAVFSPENTNHMSFQTSVGNGSITISMLKRPNPFAYASSDESGVFGRGSPKRVVFPFDANGCDDLASFAATIRPTSFTVENVVDRLKIGEQTPRPRKKKSRRTPKVKKIKFHEYTGPHRRTPAQKSKSANTSTSGQPADRVTNSAAKQESNEIPAEQQRTENQPDNNTSLPATMNLKTPVLQPSEQSNIPSYTGPVRIPNLFQQSIPSGTSLVPCTTAANASVGVANALLQDLKSKDSICSVKMPPTTPPVAKAGTSAPLLVPIIARRKDKPIVIGNVATLNGVDRKASRRDGVVAENPLSLDDLKVAELKEECKKRKLSVTGPKPRLVNRLLPFADDILNQRILLSPGQSDFSTLSHVKLQGDFKPNFSNCEQGARRLPVGAPGADFSSQQTVQTPAISSSRPKANSVAECRYSSELAGIAAFRPAATIVPTSLSSLSNSAISRPQSSDLCSLIGYQQRRNICDSGVLNCNDFPHDEKDAFEEDVLLAFCKEMSKVPASKLPNNGPLSDERKPTALTLGAAGQGVISVGPFLETSRAESLCKVHQQQFLTPPATPTLQTNGSLSCSPETSRGAEIEASNQGICHGLSSIALHGIGCKLSPCLAQKGTTKCNTLTDAELWMVQEKQIAELQLQLQKSKVELSHARRKVGLQENLSGDYLTPGIALGKVNDIFDVPRSLAQPQVSPDIDTGITSNVYGAPNLERAPGDVDPDSKVPAQSGNVLQHCDRRGSQTGTVAAKVPVGLGIDEIGGEFLAGEIPSEPDTQGGRTAEELLPHSRTDSSEVPSSTDESSDTVMENSYLVEHPYFTTPAKDPPGYQEAVRQKLVTSYLLQQQHGLAPSSARESTESASSEDLVGPSTAALSCSTPGLVKREEIEDVIEVLFGNGELATAESHPNQPFSERIWLDDVRAVIRDLALSTPSYFKPLEFDPDSPETPTSHVTCVSSQPEVSWSTGRPEVVERHVASGQLTGESCNGTPMGFVGLDVPWVGNEGTPCSSDDLSELPYVGFDWNEPPELSQSQFSWGSNAEPAARRDHDSATTSTTTATTKKPPVDSTSCPGSFCPTVLTPLPFTATSTGSCDDVANPDDDIPGRSPLCRHVGRAPVSPDAEMDSVGDLLTSEAGTVQELRWEGEWMDVFEADGRRSMETAMNLFPAFAFSP